MIAHLPKKIATNRLEHVAIEPHEAEAPVRVQDAGKPAGRPAHVSIRFSSSSMHSVGSAVNISSPRHTHFCQR